MESDGNTTHNRAIYPPMSLKKMRTGGNNTQHHPFAYTTAWRPTKINHSGVSDPFFIYKTARRPAVTRHKTAF